VHRHRSVSAPSLQASASSGAQNRHSACRQHAPLFVVWRKERVIKLTRAMTLQLLRGGMTRAVLPRPSQTKRRERIEEWALPSGGSCRPLLKLSVLSSKDSCRTRESTARRVCAERASRGDKRAAGGYGGFPLRCVLRGDGHQSRDTGPGRWRASASHLRVCRVWA
jgi:hypothetical protein